MTVLDRLASALQRGDEAPNQELAREIAQANDTAAVRELAANLVNADKAIQSDCIKVLYEIGALNPDMIAPYCNDFVNLLKRRNNRLVWGAMTALGAIAGQKADELWPHVDLIFSTTLNGSVITQDWGVRVLAAISARNSAYEQRIVPFLKTFLQDCPSKDLPRHAESVLIAINPSKRDDFVRLFEARMPSLKPAQAK